MPTESTYDRPHRIGPVRLWFGAVGGAVAWALQGFTCFTMAAQACKDGPGNWGPFSPTAVRVLIGCVSAAYLAVALAACYISYQNWRALADGRRFMEAEGYGREEYMALAGVLVGLTASVGLIWASIPPIFVSSCNTFR